MKITEFWADNASTINTLKVSCICLSVTSVAFSTLLMYLSAKPPVVVERSCTTTALKVASSSRTADEIDAFLKVAVPARFNSDIDKPDYLTQGERTGRKLEQKKLSGKKIKQMMLVEGSTPVEDYIIVRATRLISVENIRSAFPFALRVNIQRVGRTESNPYGMVLSQVKDITEQTLKKASESKGSDQ